jgi:hypothetical protein
LIKIQNNKSLIIEIEDLKKRLNNIKNNEKEEKKFKKTVTIYVPKKVEDEDEKNKKLSLKKTKTQNEINKNNNDNKNNANNFLKHKQSSKFAIENKFNRINLKINTKQSQQKKNPLILIQNFYLYILKTKKMNQNLIII